MQEMLEMTMMQENVLSGLKIRRGEISEIDRKGRIRVADKNGDFSLWCHFLKTSGGPLPRLKPGDAVLYGIDGIEIAGYVIGVIQSYLSDTKRQPEDARQELYPPNKYKRIRFDAEEKIEFHCGESSLSMDEHGKIVLRGRKIVSRAKETNKIKGGSVQLN